MPQIVTGWRDIAQVFSVRPVDVRRWHEAGAPIVILPAKSQAPCTDISELWAWLKHHQGQGGGTGQGKQVTAGDAQPSSPAGQKGTAGNVEVEAPTTCPQCGTDGSMRWHGDGWRCEWCRFLL